MLQDGTAEWLVRKISSSRVYVGTTTPVDKSVEVWIDPSTPAALTTDDIDKFKKFHVYNTVADMVADTSVQEGTIAWTLGYNAPNDGGGGQYYIHALRKDEYDKNSVSLWERTGLRFSDGSKYTAGNAIMSTITYLDIRMTNVITPTEYKVSLLAYKKSDESYVGTWDGTEFIPMSESGAKIFDEIEIPASDAYQYKLCVSRADGDNFTIEDAVEAITLRMNIIDGRSYIEVSNDLVAQYTALGYVRVVNTKADLSTAILFEGQIARTLGETEKNDGGGRSYIIREKASSDITDGTFLIDIGNNLVAELFDVTTDITSLINGETTSRNDAIAALDATVGSTSIASGKHVAVQVVETDGKLTGLTVTENDIASAQELADEIANRTNAINSLDATVGSGASNSAVVPSNKHVAVQVVETDGKLSGITVNENDIASAATLQTVVDYLTSQPNLGTNSITTITTDGYYYWIGTINGIGSGKWRIQKAMGIYEAHYLSDPRVYFISTDGSNWYSPYGSWHV